MSPELLARDDNDEDTVSVDHSLKSRWRSTARAHEYLFRCRGWASVVRQPPGVSSRSELKIAQEGSEGEVLWGSAFKYTLSCSMYRNP